METSDDRTSVTATLERPRPRAERIAPVVAAKPLGRSVVLTVLGLVWAVGLLAAGVVGIHDSLADTGTYEAWIERAVARVNGLQADRDVLIAAGVAGLVGVVLTMTALWPRRRRRALLRSQAGVQLRRRHLERLLAGWMETRDGVLGCGVDARGRTIYLEVRAVDGVDAAELYGGVIASVRDELGVLVQRPEIQICLREAD